MKIARVDEMRHMDAAAISDFGIPETLLMENAGLAAFHLLCRKIPLEVTPVAVLCGSGNNGGDGLVVARKIHSAGGRVQVILLGDPDRFQGAARINLNILTRLPVDILRRPETERVRECLRRCGVIIDGIFGTGLARDVEGRYAEVIAAVNESGRPVLSLDIPSGIDGDSGRIMGAAIRARWTVTFGLPKIGNMLYPGYDYGGELFVTHISFPPALYADPALQVAVNRTPALPVRDPEGHKGRFGDALFIAGSAGYLGAPYFAAMAHLKAGGGYARLAAPAGVVPFIAMKGSEIVCHPQPQTDEGSLAGSAGDALAKLADDRDMVVMGPGLSRHPETLDLVRALVPRIRRPLILDGDAITAVCADRGVLKEREETTILTPHVGEMARLTGNDPVAISGNRIPILQETAAGLNAIVVLKGPHTLIGYPDGRVFVNLSGNPGMATAGSGDVLTGAITAMRGLGLPVPTAVRKGVFIHGLAGDLAARDKGEDGITAQDILDFLPAAIACDRRGATDPHNREFAGPEVIA